MNKGIIIIICGIIFNLVAFVLTTIYGIDIKQNFLGIIYSVLTIVPICIGLNIYGKSVDNRKRVVLKSISVFLIIVLCVSIVITVISFSY